MSDATGFIREQRHNRRASVVILAGTFGLLFIVANLVAGILGAYTKNGECTTVRGRGGFPEQSCTTEFHVNWVVLGVVAVVVLGYLIFAWLASSKAALTIVQAKPAEGPEYAELRALVEQMSIASGIPVPETYVVQDNAPNAFATGRNPDHAAITVTTGLLAIMSRRELRGVLAHEMAHIRNRDIAVTTIAVLAVGAIAVIGDIALRVGIFGGMGRRNNDNGGGAALFLILSLAIYLIAVPAGLLLKAALSRKRESLADAERGGDHPRTGRYPVGPGEAGGGHDRGAAPLRRHRPPVDRVAARARPGRGHEGVVRTPLRHPPAAGRAHRHAAGDRGPRPRGPRPQRPLPVGSLGRPAAAGRAHPAVAARSPRGPVVPAALDAPAAQPAVGSARRPELSAFGPQDHHLGRSPLAVRPRRHRATRGRGLGTERPRATPTAMPAAMAVASLRAATRAATASSVRPMANPLIAR